MFYDSFAIRKNDLKKLSHKETTCIQQILRSKEYLVYRLETTQST